MSYNVMVSRGYGHEDRHEAVVSVSIGDSGIAQLNFKNSIYVYNKDAWIEIEAEEEE